MGLIVWNRCQALDRLTALLGTTSSSPAWAVSNGRRNRSCRAGSPGDGAASAGCLGDNRDATGARIYGWPFEGKSLPVTQARQAHQPGNTCQPVFEKADNKRSGSAKDAYLQSASGAAEFNHHIDRVLTALVLPVPRGMGVIPIGILVANLPVRTVDDELALVLLRGPTSGALRRAVCAMR